MHTKDAAKMLKRCCKDAAKMRPKMRPKMLQRCCKDAARTQTPNGDPTKHLTQLSMDSPGPWNSHTAPEKVHTPNGQWGSIASRLRDTVSLSAGAAAHCPYRRSSACEKPQAQRPRAQALSQCCPRRGEAKTRHGGMAWRGGLSNLNSCCFSEGTALRQSLVCIAKGLRWACRQPEQLHMARAACNSHQLFLQSRMLNAICRTRSEHSERNCRNQRGKHK